MYLSLGRKKYLNFRKPVGGNDHDISGASHELQLSILFLQVYVCTNSCDSNRYLKILEKIGIWNLQVAVVPDNAVLDTN
jgi:hypothetical protein